MDRYLERISDINYKVIKPMEILEFGSTFVRTIREPEPVSWVRRFGSGK